MKSNPKILILEDNSSFKLFLKESLKDIAELAFADTIFDAKKIIKSNEFDLYLLDMKLPDGKGVEILDELREKSMTGRAVILTAFGDIPMAIDAVRKGALDFWQKPIDYEVLRERVKNLLNENDYRDIDEIIIGESEYIKKIRDDVKRLSGTDINVMISGPSGTGKELIAKEIHFHSLRSKSKFVHIDFNSIPSELLESELFGAVKGAYTGSYENREGRVKMSDRGTLYFDNIDNSDLKTQAKLIRFVQDKSYYPIGSSKEVKIDARIISSVSSDLKSLIESNTLREDLVFRLNVYVINTCNIRERREDIEPIAKHFIKVFSEQLNKDSAIFTESLIEEMKRFDWKGNEREIINFIERTLITQKTDFIEAEREFETTSLKSRVKTIKNDYEKKEIINALKRSGNNKSEASRMLKISYRNLIDKIKEYKIEE